MDSIESVIIRGLLFNDAYASKIYPHLKDQYFEGTTKTIFSAYSHLYDKYNKKPTLQAMLIHLENLPLNEDVFSDSISTLKGAYESRNDPLDAEWLADETEKYVVDKATYNALYESIQILEGNDDKRDKHAIPDIMTDALSISFDAALGSDYFEDAEKRFAHYINPEARLELPLKALQILTNGGLPPKTLNVLLAGCVHPKTKVKVRLKRKQSHNH